MILLVQMLALIGTTLIVVRSAIFRPIRKVWPALLECAQCSGLWIGALAGLSGEVVLGGGRIVDTITLAASASFSALLADAILLHLLGGPKEPQ